MPPSSHGAKEHSEGVLGADRERRGKVAGVTEITLASFIILIARGSLVHSGRESPKMSQGLGEVDEEITFCLMFLF